MIKNLLTPILLLACITMATAQNATTLPAWRTYGTQKRMIELRAANPEMAEAIAAIERFTYEYRHTGAIEPILIPVVVHLLPLPDGATISADAIVAGLNRLNADFFTPEHPYLDQKYQHPGLLLDLQGNIEGSEADQQTYLHPADRREHFAEKAGLPALRFCLANIDPNGQSTTGIVQITGAPQEWTASGNDLHSTANGGSDPWDTKHYCNIWIAQLKDGVCGYAQMPGGPATTDGIAIDYRYWANAAQIAQYGTTITQPTTEGTLPDPQGGNPYWLGRTLVHLMGGYLNVHELWNETMPCGDDYVEDTPIHNAPNGRFGQDYHVSTCDGNPVEMTMNLMDNTDDDGQYLFTWGQVMRMQAVLATGGPRFGLRSTSTNCTLTDGLVEGDERTQQESNDGSTGLKVGVFPNPATRQFALDVQINGEIEAGETLEAIVLNEVGTPVWQQSIAAPAQNIRIQVDTQGWPSGLYTALVRVGKWQRVVLVAHP